jgi:hypothetical protein
MRIKINLILGALIALLSGCKAPQEAVQQNAIRVMYGPPAYFQQQAQPSDTTDNNVESEKNNS